MSEDRGLGGDTTIDWQPLIDAALAVRERAHAPYSRFQVGAALSTSDGRIFAGCNVENRSYGLTLCAERSAVLQAVAAGTSRLAAIAIVADASPPARPCGACLETLNEFARDLPILLFNLTGEQEEVRLRELFPQPFQLPPDAARSL